MQELHDELIEQVEGNIYTNLLDTSIRWAEHVLKKNEGKALDYGLEIAKSLANYHHELNPHPQEGRNE